MPKVRRDQSDCPMNPYHWLALHVLHYFRPLFDKKRLSRIYGEEALFLGVYEGQDGNPYKLKNIDHDMYKTWWKARMKLVRQHIREIERKKEEIWDVRTKELHPTQRHLAMIMIGYSPDARGVGAWIRERYSFPERVVTVRFYP